MFKLIYLSLMAAVYVILTPIGVDVCMKFVYLLLLFTLFCWFSSILGLSI